MTRTGEEYLDGLRDGRRVYLDGRRVPDVTTHPAFRGATRSIARTYDLVNAPDNRDLLTFSPPGHDTPANQSFMIPRCAADLTARRRALKRLSEVTFGLVGRGPEHVAGFLAAFAGNAHVFARGGDQFRDNVITFYEHVRDNDLFVSYVIVPPQIDRSKPAHQQADPHLHAGVVAERDGGIIVKGAQMLGTATAVSDYVLLSCIHPLQAGDENHAITVAVRVGDPGCKLYSRRSYAEAASSEFDYPLSSRFDEGDALVVFDDVFVPWERVFVYRDIDIVRAQFFETGAHALGNNQAQIRFWTKLELLVGLARRVAEMTGVLNLPPVQGTLGEIAAHVATVEGLVRAQEAHCEQTSTGVFLPGRQELYANMTMQSSVYPRLLGMLRELAGGGLIQLPSSVKDFENPEISADIERYVQSPGTPARQRVALLKLLWDMVGSEFASRHHQYEMFYAGAPHMTKGFMYRNYDFSRGEELVDRALSGLENHD